MATLKYKFEWFCVKIEGFHSKAIKKGKQVSIFYFNFLMDISFPNFQWKIHWFYNNLYCKEESSYQKANNLMMKKEIKVW